MGEVITELRKAKMEREESHRYLETIVHHVNIGLITMDDKGEVSLVNPAAKRLLNISVLRNISALGKISAELEEKIRTLRSGEKALIKIHTEQEIMQVIISAAEFKLANKNFKLISIQNLNHELEENEIQVWQKLIRVLTHEIMNSVTPMTTLADSVHEMLFDNTGGKPVLRQLKPTDEEDIENALTLIGQRSKGLLSFVGAYRNLTRIPVPDRKVFPVGELIKGIAQLLQNDLRNKHVTLTYTISPPGLELFADSDLMEQVLINLILNAVHAVEDRGEKRITLTAEIDTAGRVNILFTDSGGGIPGDVADKIFIPFFTTRREGSGIGLSISRQIVRLHGGQLNLLRTGPEGTTFQVRI